MPAPSQRAPHFDATRDRLPTLDGIRGLAIIAVFLSHASFDSTTSWLGRWFTWGWMGVDLFFVLSGFLITGLLVRERERSGTISLRDFYARRARRILPAAAVVLVLIVIASWFMV
ncbi:MAG TPA: acyltransferase, partial [Gemmatimonadaceae bacterium]|nr:acyltransferase [Gemmatimonadaceae bacterium]